MSQLLVMCSGEKVNKLQKRKLHDQNFFFFRENTHYEKIYLFIIQVFAIKSGILDKKRAKCRSRVSP